jgi:kumamolisin
VQAPPEVSAALVRSELTDAEASGNMDFSVSLKMRNFAELQQRINNHELISAAEMTAKYYPLASEYNNVAEWLRSQGFSVKPAGTDNLSVFASGSVKQIAAAFNVKFGRVKFAGLESVSALTAPSLPTEAGAQVLSINGLQPERRPKHRSSQEMQKLIVPSGGGQCMISDIAEAYNVPPDLTGSGQKIGIVIDTFPTNSDLLQFWHDNAVAQSLGNIEDVQVVAGVLPAPSGEESLDVEWTSGMAPAAKIRVYATTDLSTVHLDQAYQRILNELPSQPELHQLSLSYGLGETYESRTQILTDSQYFASLAARGVSVFVAAGDGSSRPGPDGHFHVNATPQVEYPASDPHVTAVGGTMIALDPANLNFSSPPFLGDIIEFETVWNAASGDGGGSGVSHIFSRPGWQTGAGVPPGGFRCVPDVASAADGWNASGQGAYVILYGQVTPLFGTSWAAPTWAAFCARINQARASVREPPIGFLNPYLYALNGTSSFRDIISGGSYDYLAGPGYDLCTGIGVPNVLNLKQSLTTGLHPVAKDFNGDGYADLIWENTVTGQRVIWYLKKGAYQGYVALPTVPTQWRIAGSADFLGTGQSDLIWDNTATGAHWLWIFENGAVAYYIPLPTMPTQWRIAGASNFFPRYWDSFGNSQIFSDMVAMVWENTATGEHAIWYYQRGVFLYSVTLPTLPTQWHIAAVADILGDDKDAPLFDDPNTGAHGRIYYAHSPDLVWENTITGERMIWILSAEPGYVPPPNGNSYGIPLPTMPTQWHIAGAADFTGSGQAGLVWENAVTGQRAIWVLKDGVPQSYITLPTTITQWHIAEH